MVLKIVNGNYIKSYDEFKFEIWENLGRYYSGKLKWKNTGQKHTALMTIFFSHQKYDFPSKNIKNT